MHRLVAVGYRHVCMAYVHCPEILLSIAHVVYMFMLINSVQALNLLMMQYHLVVPKGHGETSLAAAYFCCVNVCMQVEAIITSFCAIDVCAVPQVSCVDVCARGYEQSNKSCTGYHILEES